MNSLIGFPQARTAYLRGDWAEAEGLLTDVLAIEPRDPPALLLLTGVYRHTGRLGGCFPLATRDPPLGNRRSLVVGSGSRKSSAGTGDQAS